MTTTLTLERLENLKLLRGSHASREEGVCFMEAVAWFAGEPHTAYSKSVSPVLGAFLRGWDDDLDDAGRQRLKPYIPRVIGTAGDADADKARAWLATDWMIRVYTPAWLELAGLNDQALALRGLPMLDSSAAASAAQATIEGARTAAASAWDYIWVTAWDGWATAWDGGAGGAASRAGATAGAAAEAARAAADDAVKAAASTAIAAIKKLEPTKVLLQFQESAFGLLDRMIAVANLKLGC